MKKLIFLMVLSLTACSDNQVKLEINTIAQGKYYQSEIFPEDLKGLYGKWKLVSVTGGFSGSGFEPNFDYLEIKKFGIYGIVKDEELIEVGKIVPKTFDPKSKSPQVQFVADSTRRGSLLATFSYRYVKLEITHNKLSLESSCCDAFDHQFQRVR